MFLSRYLCSSSFPQLLSSHLPVLFRTDRPKTIPMSRSIQLKLYYHPLILLCIGIGTGWFLCLILAPRIPYLSSSSRDGRTKSPFLIQPSRFIPPPPRGPPPANLPDPVPVKKEGMLVPDAVHYVYGLKPVTEGERGEELPYYAYLAMRSAMINLRPSVIYLCVLPRRDFTSHIISRADHVMILYEHSVSTATMSTCPSARGGIFWSPT